jgi:hypothetical protein
MSFPEELTTEEIIALNNKIPLKDLDTWWTLTWTRKKNQNENPKTETSQ